MGAVGNGDTDLNISHEPGGPSASGRVMFRRLVKNWRGWTGEMKIERWDGKLFLAGRAVQLIVD